MLLFFDHKPRVLAFYKKRILRILPTYLVFFIVYGIAVFFLASDKFSDYLWQYSVISFFVSKELKVWFVASILFLYLIFPLIYYLVRKLEVVLYFLILLIIVLLLLPVWTPIKLIDDVFLTRIPSFMIGVMIGKRIINKTVLITKKRLIVFFVLEIVFIVLFIVNILVNEYKQWIVERLLFTPIAFFFVVVVSNIFEISRTKKEGGILSLIGRISFETYLLHVPILTALDMVMTKFFGAGYFSMYISNVFSIVFTVLIGIIFKKGIDYLIGIILRKSKTA